MTWPLPLAFVFIWKNYDRRALVDSLLARGPLCWLWLSHLLGVLGIDVARLVITLKLLPGDSDFASIEIGWETRFDHYALSSRLARLGL